MDRATILIIGVTAVLGLTWVWHGPLGTAQAFAARAEAAARAQLDHDEMIHIRASLERDPLTRRLILSGPADDFQRREIKRRMEELPGIAEAGWSPSSLPSESAR